MSDFIQLGKYNESAKFARTYEDPCVCFDEYNRYYVRINRAAIEALGFREDKTYYSTARFSPNDMVIALKFVQADNPPGKTFRKVSFFTNMISARVSVSGLYEALNGQMPSPGYYPMHFGEDGTVYVPISPADKVGEKRQDEFASRRKGGRKLGNLSVNDFLKILKSEAENEHQ